MNLSTTPRRVSAVLFALGLLAPGCRFEADFADTEYRCDQSGECPDGQSCVDGICRVGLVDPPPDPPPVGELECGTMGAAMQTFDADFDLENIDWRRWNRWTNGITALEIVDGQLVISAPLDEDGNGAGFGTRSIFPAATVSTSVEIIALDLDDTTDASLKIEARQDSTHASIYYQTGNLVMHYHPPGDSQDMASFAFDPVQHRFWRIRQYEGAMRWETSADGVEFVEHVRLEDVSELGQWVESSVNIYKGRPGEQPVSMTVDNFNTAQEPVPYCPSGVLVDDFSSPTTDPLWYLTDSGVCTIQQQDGRMGFDFPTAESAECIQRSVTLYDLTESTLTVEAPLAHEPGIEQCFVLYLNSYQDVEFELLDGQLRGEKSLDTGSSTVFSIQFDPERHRYWRFRGDGDNLYWELSADRQDWQIMGSHQGPELALEIVRAGFEGSSDTGLVSNLGQSFGGIGP